MFKHIKYQYVKFCRQLCLTEQTHNFNMQCNDNIDFLQYQEHKIKQVFLLNKNQYHSHRNYHCQEDELLEILQSISILEPLIFINQYHKPKNLSHTTKDHKLHVYQQEKNLLLPTKICIFRFQALNTSY
jgi:hypothetical protein